MMLALIVKLIPDEDRRNEIQAELYEVPRWERPYWVAQQFEVALQKQGLPLGPGGTGASTSSTGPRLESGVERNREYQRRSGSPTTRRKHHHCFGSVTYY